MTKKVDSAVAVVMGSASDKGAMLEAKAVLDEFDVPSVVRIISAHRSPDLCRRFAREASAKGVRVIIAGAGKAAHLAGVIASHTVLPVIGVPLDTGMSGMDSLLSTAQMPRGVPVACMATGKSGAANAALLAVAILALGDERLMRRLRSYRRKMAAQIARESVVEDQASH
ncbi:MAG: 5-(carboxyamino)imidazole ribonucleotide mutase [candidate division WOR-3 bacterium]